MIEQAEILVIPKSYPGLYKVKDGGHNDVYRGREALGEGLLKEHLGKRLSIEFKDICGLKQVLFASVQVEGVYEAFGQCRRIEFTKEFNVEAG